MPNLTRRSLFQTLTALIPSAFLATKLEAKEPERFVEIRVNSWNEAQKVEDLLPHGLRLLEFEGQKYFQVRDSNGALVPKVAMCITGPASVMEKYGYKKPRQTYALEPVRRKR